MSLYFQTNFNISKVVKKTVTKNNKEVTEESIEDITIYTDKIPSKDLILFTNIILDIQLNESQGNITSDNITEAVSRKKLDMESVVRSIENHLFYDSSFKKPFNIDSYVIENELSFVHWTILLSTFIIRIGASLGK